MHGESEDRDIHWLTPAAEPMTSADWEAGYARCVGMLLDGRMVEEFDADGEPLEADTVLLLMNASEDGITFTLPPLDEGWYWQCELDTFYPARRPKDFTPGYSYRLRTRSMSLFVRRRERRSLLRKRAGQK
jgi:glycogen operon protein